jgi:hypothetical protein
MSFIAFDRRRAWVAASLAASLAAVFAAGAATTHAVAAPSVGRPDLRKACQRYASVGVHVATCARQLAAARAASAKYRDVAAAVADGFVPATQCEQDRTGGMGEHWVQVARHVDDALDPRTPEMLLYVPDGVGLRLVAVEYVETARFGGLPWFGPTEPVTGAASPAPKMFGGIRFQGPMAGHAPFQPWHYDRHVWLWEANPKGIFEQWNPRVSCPAIG